jgi:hypothetical protein
MRKKYIIYLIDYYKYQNEDPKKEIFAFVEITEDKKKKLLYLLNDNALNEEYFFKEYI